MKIRTIKNIKTFKDKKVLVRTDFNVPLKNGKIIDGTRIDMVLPTIKYLVQKGAVVVLISHLGRPKKQVSLFQRPSRNFFSFQNRYSLRPIAKYLEKALKLKVVFVSDPVNINLKEKIKSTKNKKIFLLENIRFYKEEEKNSKRLAKKLSQWGDIYINEAFSVSHRRHSSVLAITEYLPSFAGFLLEKEIKNLSKLLKKPRKPYMVLLGGAKLSTKIKLIEFLSRKADKILLGGAMANVFLKAQGQEIGRSLIEKSMIKKAEKILEFYGKKNKKIFLPQDVVTAKSFSSKARPKVKKINHLEKNDIILDIGPETILQYANFLKKAKTILWNGPMGKYELKPFQNGSLILGRLIALRSSLYAYGVCGGGETIDVLNKTQMTEFMDWVSSGGGAMLTFLSGEKLPGLEAIIKNNLNI